MSGPSARSARRLAFTVEYDGTDFHGWATQPDVHPTIQQLLTDAVAEIVGHPVRVDGASRTDAGVHARDQRAAVTVHHPIRPAGLVKAINRRLPAAIAVRDAHEVSLDHHPRFANGGKTYCYRLRRGVTARPLTDRYAWQVPWDLDFERLLPALPAVLGTRDYASFASRGGDYRTTVRTLWRWSLQPEAHGVWALRVSGTAFMKHMVRNLVGTLVQVARGHWSAADLQRAVAACDRTAAGPTAPACGLTLERIHPLGASDASD